MTEKKQEVTMDQLRAQLMEMLEQAKTESAALIADARAEAARIVAEAHSGGRSEATGMTEEELAAYRAYMNEEVEVKLFRDNDKYRDPVFVGCNGETVAIQRGERVRIRRKFAQILDNSDRQDQAAGQLIARKSAEFAQAGV